MKKFLICLATVLIATCVVAQAEGKAFQASLTPDIAIYDRTQMIEGLALSVWGENPQTALAIGLVNGSSGDSAGVSLAFLLNYAESYKGVQFAAVNYVTKDFMGWQWALVNYTEGSVKGLQTGWINYAGKLTGLQLGLLNYAGDADTAVQIGFVNIIASNTEWFTGLPEQLAPGMVFLNWRF